MKTGTLIRLSYAQQALWLIYKEAPKNAAYNMALPLQFVNEIDAGVLKQAIHQLAERHPILRTIYGEHNGQPYQYNVADLKLDYWQEISTTGWSEKEISTKIYGESRKPFVLEESVFRATLFRGSKTILLLTMHHITGDAASVAILGRDLLTLYAAAANKQKTILPELTADYNDYVQLEEELLDSKKGKRMKAYWQNILSGPGPVLQLPTDYPRPSVKTYNGDTLVFELPTTLRPQLNALAKAHDSQLFSVLLSAWLVLLHRYSGQSDIWVGVPASVLRKKPRFANMAGYLVNPMIIRGRFPEGNTLSFSELIRQVSRQLFQGLYHQPYPFTKLAGHLQFQRNPAYPPLVQVMCAMELDDLIPRYFSSGGYTAERLNIKHMEGQFDITLSFSEDAASVEKPDNLQLHFKYDTELFYSETIARLANHLKTLLTNIITSSQDTSIDQLDLLTEKEKHQILVEWNDTEADYPKDKCIHQLFEEQAAKTPDNIAVVFEEQRLTYQELNQKSNQLALYLQQQGVKPDSLVAICIERSLEMLIGILGILKAGGAYVPVDPEYPDERIAYMLEDSAPQVVLTQARIASKIKKLAQGSGSVVLSLDKEWEMVAKTTGTIKQEVQIHHLIYVIYTSGSTGKPKGVANIHQGFLNLSLWYSNQLNMQMEDRVIVISNPGFDLTQKNLLAPLLKGASLYLVRSYDPLQIGSLIAEKHITWLNCAPSSFYGILENHQGDLSDLSSLRRVILGGEPIQYEKITAWFASDKNKAELYNSYGPTESSDVVSYYQCKQAMQTFPIGRPISNVRLYILDKNNQPQLVGVTGELCIAGDGLSRGYLNRPELTAEKFIDNPFNPGTKLYKTGDLCRWLPNGNIEYTGRIDHQVKVRGFRIECSEIENVLNKHPQIDTCVVLAKELNNSKQLVAYYLTQEDVTPEISELRSYLKKQLPDYMVPAAFVKIDAIPITSNGKTDRQALEKIEVELTGTHEYVAPSTEQEKTLVKIWSEVLAIEESKIGIHDNFFDLGGHSLLAVKLMSLIQSKLNVDVPLSNLLTQNTVTALATHLRANNLTVKQDYLVPPVLLLSIIGVVPLHHHTCV